MIYRLLRPLLFQFDPERAHHAALAVASRIARHRKLAEWSRATLARPGGEPVEHCGLTFPHRIGLAAGFDKNAEAPFGWWACGFGFIELGTVTPQPQPGNPRPRMFRFTRQRALVNRMGFNNEGAERVAERLASFKQQGLFPPFPVGVSIGKNATTPLERAVDDYVTAAGRLAEHADFVTVNISSPNTPGLRSLQTPADIRILCSALRQPLGPKPLFVKFAPECAGEELDKLLDACLENGVSGIIASNTIAVGDQPDFPRGGLSGHPLRQMALKQVESIRRHVEQRVVVVGCGGIDDVPSAQAMFDAGADLVQLYTGLVFKGPFLPGRLSRRLLRRETT